MKKDIHGTDDTALAVVMRLIRRRGVFGAIVAGVWHLLMPVNHFIDRGYDIRHNVDTAGRTLLHKLDIRTQNYKYATVYEPAPPRSFRQIMDAIDVEAYPLFVDFGSGKGRALLLAAEYPFLVVRGIEFGRELHEAAKENIARHRGDRLKCKQVDSVYADAALFKPPPVPSVFFFYSPFSGEVMAPIIEHLKESMKTQPRPMVIIQWGVRQEVSDLLDSLGWAKEEIRLPYRIGEPRRLTVFKYSYSL
jgi:hypothetical protein